MVAANPHMFNPLESNAVILIDEIDLHLHPEWQSSLAEKLPRIFPRAQFIISSHSPSVMAAARSLYRLNDTAASGRFEQVDSPYGRNPSDLLSSVLNARRESPSAAKIAEMYAALDAADFQRAQTVIGELDKMIPEDPEVLRGEYLLRALKPKGAK